MKPFLLPVSILLFALSLFLGNCSNDTITSSSSSIRVTEPASSDIADAGRTCAIKWSTTGKADPTVMIDLYGDTGFVRSIASSAPNSGDFSWLVPSDLPGDTACRIKVTGGVQSSVFGFSATFTLVNNTDRYEPDGSPSLATSIDTSGLPQKHRISAPDTDWFKFDATGGRTYCIQTHGNASTWLWLYATNALTLLTSDNNYSGTGNNGLIVWTCLSSGTYYFKVAAPYQPAGADYTIDIRSGGAVLAITSPVSGIIGLTSGSTLSIAWSYSVNVGTAVSLYAFRDDTLAGTIALSTRNLGNYPWTIPWSMPTSSSYRIKIVSDNDTSIHDLSDRFTITHIPSALTITAPTSSARWSTDSTYSIYWTHSGNFGSYVKVELYDSASYLSTVSSSTYMYNSFSWTIPSSLATSSSYRIKVTSTADTSVYDFSDPFTIIKVPITLTITTPSAGTGWNSGSSYWVYWTYTGKPGSYVTLALYDSTRFVSAFPQTYTLSNNSCIWAIPFTVSTSSTYRLKITSTSDTSIYGFSSPFSITKIPTTLTLTTPSAATNWNTGTAYSIYWTYTGNPGNYVNLSLWDSASSSQISTITSTGSTTYNSYSWLIPPTIASGNYRIRIASMQDTTIYSYSSVFRVTNIPTTITVTTPGASTVWNAGTSYSVYWSYTGSIGTNATLALYNDTTLVQPISSSTPVSTGTCTWAVPSMIQGGARYRIKIASFTYPSIGSFSDYFTIAQVPSRLTITTPGTATSWNTGTTYYIYWTYAGAPGSYVKLDLYDSSALVQTISTSATTTAGSLQWLVPSSLRTGSNYRIKITSTTQDTVFNLSSLFTITNIPASIAVTAPAAGAVINASASLTIYWNYSGPVPGSYVSVSLVDSLGAVSSISSSVYRTNGYYAWYIPSTQPGGGKFRIRVASTTDTSVAGYSGAFTIVPIPPHLTITSPDTLTSWTAGYNYTIYWSSTGSPGANVKLDLYDTTALVQTISQSLYTTNGNLLWNVPPSLPTDNRYRVKIASTTQDTVFAFSRYFQIVNPSSADSYEPDSTFSLAKPIVVGAAAQSHSLSSGDKDWLSFAATSGKSYAIQTFGSTDTYLNLFSTNGTTLITSDDDGSGSGLNAKIVWTCTTSGTYYFEVTSSYGAVGNYTVSVQ